MVIPVNGTTDVKLNKERTEIIITTDKDGEYYYVHASLADVFFTLFYDSRQRENELESEFDVE